MPARSFAQVLGFADFGKRLSELRRADTGFATLPAQEQYARAGGIPEVITPDTAQTLTQMIGRAPTDKELATFKATLNGYERGHPELTTTTENYDDMGNVSATNVVHSGGVTDAARQTVLGKGVQKTKEYGKYQAGTTYFNALLQMLGGG